MENSKKNIFNVIFPSKYTSSQRRVAFVVTKNNKDDDVVFWTNKGGMSRCNPHNCLCLKNDDGPIEKWVLRLQCTMTYHLLSPPLLEKSLPKGEMFAEGMGRCVLCLVSSSDQGVSTNHCCRSAPSKRGWLNYSCTTSVPLSDTCSVSQPQTREWRIMMTVISTRRNHPHPLFEKETKEIVRLME